MPFYKEKNTKIVKGMHPLKAPSSNGLNALFSRDTKMWWDLP